jgi:hypothetical protein
MKPRRAMPRARRVFRDKPYLVVSGSNGTFFGGCLYPVHDGVNTEVGLANQRQASDRVSTFMPSASCTFPVLHHVCPLNRASGSNGTFFGGCLYPVHDGVNTEVGRRSRIARLGFIPSQVPLANQRQASDRVSTFMPSASCTFPVLHHVR